MIHHKDKFHLLFPLVSILTLVWFLIRVIPKPSRAMYPCMRIAAPIASSFIIWLIGLFSTWLFLGQARLFFNRSRYFMGMACIVTAGVVGAIFFSFPHSRISAFPRASLVAPNNPIGTAMGINPGRVVWAYDSSVATWRGPGFGHWWQSENTNQKIVDTMLGRSLAALCGRSSALASWDTLFKHYNASHGRGFKGYQRGEKIVIKTNFTSSNHISGWCSVDPATYSFVKKHDFFNTSPQLIRSLLRQLVTVLGVNQSDISVGDPVCYYPNEYYDSCHAEFPEVKYLDYEGKFGRTKAEFSTVPIHWSCRPAGVKQDYIEKHLAEATYIVNCAVMKSHAGNGITLCAKSHYGSFIRLPVDSGYYDLHKGLPFLTPAMGLYRPLVDIMGHAHLGGKTILYLVDGIYSQNHNKDTMPRKWSTAPFNNNWSASIFASQDPVAIESMLLDLYQLDDDTIQYPKMAGVEDYLIEAALADNPPSKTFYDPDHAAPTSRLKSLGVFEHWNNPIDRKYSRNLGKPSGIELVTIFGATSSIRAVTHTPGQSGKAILREHGTKGDITMAVEEAGTFRLEVFDTRGRKLKTLFEGYRLPGCYRIGTQGIPGDNALRSNGRHIFVLYREQDGEQLIAARLMTSAAGDR